MLLILLAVIIAAVIYFGQNPDILKGVAEDAGIKTLQRAEAEEVPPEGEIPVQYEFPYDAFYEGYANYLDVDVDVATYTDENGLIPTAYFKSVGGELWLRWNFDAPGGGFGFVYDESGQVWEIAAEEITYQPGSSAVGLAASVFAELEEGGYHICLTGDDPSLYYAYYVAVYEAADFTPSEFTVVTEDRTNAALDMQRFLPFYLEDPQDITVHFNNLGENTFVQVLQVTKLTYPGEVSYKYRNMPEGSYEISPDGCSVTIHADYLSDCDVYSQPLFLFVRRDGSEFRLDQDNEEYDSRSILVLKNDETDLPCLEGPETYSLSSGEDCVITYHNGIGQSIYSVWYWDDVECDLTITDVGSGQFTVPHEVLQQFKDSGSGFGMTVVVQMPSDLYLFPGIYIELTD